MKNLRAIQQDVEELIVAIHTLSVPEVNEAKAQWIANGLAALADDLALLIGDGEPGDVSWEEPDGGYLRSVRDAEIREMNQRNLRD
jgi:hypothetical protein